MYVVIYTGWGTCRLTVVHMGNIIINNIMRINSVFCILTTANLLLPHPVCNTVLVHKTCWKMPSNFEKPDKPTKKRKVINKTLKLIHTYL